MTSMVDVSRTEHHLIHDPGRLVLRPFIPGTVTFAGDQDRLDRMVARVLALPDARSQALLSGLLARHSHQFDHVEGKWLEHFELGRLRIDGLTEGLDLERRLLIGAVLSQAYAYEGAALTNPSMVAIGTVESGRQRFVMSARAIGEGHISSIAFITGAVDEEGTVMLDERHPHVSNGERSTPTYDRGAFTAKLTELGFMTDATLRVLDLVPDAFTAAELAKALDNLLESDIDDLSAQDAVKRMHWLAESNYELRFDPSLPLSEHVISPAAPVESRGIEDARFVRFTDDGAVTYYATYTAFDGMRILPQLIETSDFNMFRMATMTGPAVHHKGMAIFPRKIRGEYVALSRHDHERSYVLRSEQVRTWDNAEVVFGPEQEWDLVQTGNCGSPIETAHGWLVITHGVGPMRRYVLGALLLDLDEPHKVIGRLRAPFIQPEEDETYGYVPDVVYSCGSMLHAGNLITPFGYSDLGIKIAVTSLQDLIASMD